MTGGRTDGRSDGRTGRRVLFAALVLGGASVSPSDCPTVRRLSAQSLAPKPAPIPDSLRPFVGEYGSDGNILYITERGGRLEARVAQALAYPLTPVAPGDYTFPAGLYAGTRIVFAREGRGRAASVRVANAVFARRAIGPEDGRQLRVQAQRPVSDLLVEARSATPPVQPDTLLAADLVDVAALDTTIRLDVRYATTDNFLGSRFYDSPRVFLQRPAAEAVVRAHQWLRRRGYGILIHDGYRPWYVTKVFWDATPPPLRWLVANPANGSRHNRGCAVDLTLYDLATGAVVDMGGTYDEATERSQPEYPVTSDLARWHRELLRLALVQEGFARNPSEWWHFDYRDWRRYPILNVTFEELASGRQ